MKDKKKMGHGFYKDSNVQVQLEILSLRQGVLDKHFYIVQRAAQMVL
ncbi:hypothetical protein [Lysinibacillus cavernae]|nr:hypothetical protein [Lysinibacillus cavernae]